MKRRKTRIERGKGRAYAWIVAHVQHDGKECLMWPFYREGYGMLVHEGRGYKAHRLMCQMAHGPAPSAKHHAAHSCGNPGCANPRHLSWKTPAENELDKRVHGTFNKTGSRGKITPEQKKEVLALVGKMSQPRIAEKFGISRQRVSMIIADGPRRESKGAIQAPSGRWISRLKFRRQYIHLGVFDTERAAHAVYLAATERIRAGKHPLTGRSVPSA